MPIGPSSSRDSFLLATEPNVHFTAIVTTGDSLAGNGVFGGIPDGIGAFDNGNGTATVLVNHELNNLQGVVRDHGSIGAYIDRLVIDKATLAVVSSDDLIQTVHLWDDAADSYVIGTTAFSRFCSGDLAAPTAFYNPATGLGTQVHIYLTGEESGVEGRATASLTDGAHVGNTYELPFLGNMAYENLVANPYAQNKTVISLTDDGKNGQVYIYIGTKQSTGSEIDQAGLTNGALYGIRVTGILDEVNGAPANGNFTLQEIGPGGNVSNMTGAQIDAESEAEGVTSFLRPEDSAWDPQHPNTLYFTTTNSFTGNSRLYQATFTDINHPELGGTIVAVLDGTEGQRMFDNLTVADGKIILQEDPGNQSYVAKIYEYDIATDTLSVSGIFNPAQFTPGAPGFITQDEESSGVIDVTSIFGDSDTRAYLLDAQVHALTGVPATVEQGQLLLMTVDTPFLIGGNGDDILFGSAANEVLRGFNGNDRADAGSGNDQLYGGNGNDVLNGGAGNDQLFGENGTDRLDGGAGNDRIEGGNGNDVLIGGAGDDVLVGGRGDDQFVIGSLTTVGHDQIIDFTGGDRLLSGSWLPDSNNDGRIDLSSGNLVLDAGNSIDFGTSVGALRYLGDVSLDGTAYHSYGAVSGGGSSGNGGGGGAPAFTYAAAYAPIPFTTEMLPMHTEGHYGIF